MRSLIGLRYLDFRVCNLICVRGHVKHRLVCFRPAADAGGASRRLGNVGEADQRHRLRDGWGRYRWEFMIPSATAVDLILQPIISSITSSLTYHFRLEQPNEI